MVIELTVPQQELLRSIILGTMRIASKQDDAVLVQQLMELLEKLQ